MRRQRDLPPTLFYRSELVKLTTLILFFGVLVAAFLRARDPNTWIWFTGESRSAHTPIDTVPFAERSDESPALVARTAPAGGDDASDRARSIAADVDKADARDLPTAVPIDQEAEQRELFEYELQAVDDRTELTASEMHAYWRLMHWAASQSTESMLRRAKAGVNFAQIFTEPNQHRGDLIRLRLRFDQAYRWRAGESTIDGFQPPHVYDVCGWNDDSRPYNFILACPELPGGFPIGGRIDAEGDFTGYFLKLTKYEDHEGKVRAVPMLIGRIAYEPRSRAVSTDASDIWTWLIGASIVVFVGLRWIVPLVAPGPRSLRQRPRLALNADGEETMPIADWLGSAESHSAEAPPQNLDEYLNGYSQASPNGDAGLDSVDRRKG